jgi:hypothetical protein
VIPDSVKAAFSCPLCGSMPTHFGESYDGDGWIELPWTSQQCTNRHCGLPCRLWQRIGKMVADQMMMADAAKGGGE